LNGAGSLNVVTKNGIVKAFDSANVLYNENNVGFVVNKTGIYAHLTVPTIVIN
jgi:hypothetical protein